MLHTYLLFALLVATSQSYRLPELFIPSSYEINLILPPEAFTNTSSVYLGQVSVQISFTNTSNYIALHAHHDFIQIDRIIFNGSEILNGSYAVDNTTDILNISIPEVTDTSLLYTLYIDFTGRLSTTDMYGFYKSYYVDGNGTTRYLATTQFEATNARKAFPCFDEPALKATFDFSIIVPNGLNVLFNTPQNSSVTNDTTGVTSIVFNQTPLMSTYLFAVIVSDFTCTPSVNVTAVPYQVCSRSESAATRQLAVDIGPQLLDALSNFTNYDYSLAMSKMDQVAIPDFAAGAMENWGLVTYRETAILWDASQSSNRYRQRVVTVIAHEFAHQWFGNLITMKWWSEIFLNEGFATYFEFYIANEVLPSWQLDKQFVIEELHAALMADSLANAHALQSPCTTPGEISSKFSTISYGKGGSVLRMVEHFMQLQNFRSGLQNYVVRYQFNNTEPEDLWNTLNETVVDSVSRLPTNLTTVMEGWVKNPGYPLLTVSLNGDQVTVSQRRFLLSGEQTQNEWYVPISYTTSVDTNKFQSTTPNVWLTPSQNVTITLPNNTDWIILNNQQTGYYRVNYDTILWNRIRDALQRPNFDGISEINRAQIVDDLFNLGRSGQILFSDVIEGIKFLANDASYYPWYSALSGFSFLLRRVGETSMVGQMLETDMAKLINTLYNSVPITISREDDIIYTHTQTLAISWACKIRIVGCVPSVKNLFVEYQNTSVRPNRNLRSIVYCNALRYSLDNRTDWEFLWNAYLNAGDLATEQITILSALGCTRDTALLREFLDKTITDGSGIRPQDTLAVFQSVYLGSPEGVDVAFDFLVQQYTAIAAKYAGWNSLGNLIKGLAGTFTTQAQIDRLRTFTQTENLPEAFRVAANEALEIAETNSRLQEAIVTDLSNYYNVNQPTGGTVSITSSFLVLCVAILFLSYY